MYVCQDGRERFGSDLVGILTVLDLDSGETTEVATVHVPDELLFPRWSRDGRTAVAELIQWDTEPEEDVWIGSQVATVPISRRRSSNASLPRTCGPAIPTGARSRT